MAIRHLVFRDDFLAQPASVNRDMPVVDLVVAANERFPAWPPREKETPPEGGVGGLALFCRVLLPGRLDHLLTSAAVTGERQATQHNSS